MLPSHQDAEASLDELRALAESAGARVVGSSLHRTPEPDSATLVGSGKVREIRKAAQTACASLVVFDHDLTPTQLRNLEQALERKVLDRTQIILDIFARRARSREGKLQVELAQLNYFLPRLGGRGALLSRLGGGIGTRGPGEQKLESDRRRLRARIRRLASAIEGVRAQRALHRAHRRELELPTVALVGYTNAGKSTLFNALTRAEVLTSSRLFATLDPTVRRLALPSHSVVLLSDTVGFIRSLPPHLIAAFRATLEELDEASLLLHVIDASATERDSHLAAVEAQLQSLGLGEIRRVQVWNKADLLDDAARARLPRGPLDLQVSARMGDGLAALETRIDELLENMTIIDVDLPDAANDRRALVYRLGKVLEEKTVDGRLHLRAQVPKWLLPRLGTSVNME